MREFFEEKKNEKCDKIAICAVAARHVLKKEVPYEARKLKKQGQLVVPPGISLVFGRLAGINACARGKFPRG